MNTYEVAEKLLQLSKFKNLRKEEQDVVIEDILVAPVYPLNPSLRKVIESKITPHDLERQLAKSEYDQWLDTVFEPKKSDVKDGVFEHLIIDKERSVVRHDH